MYDQLQLAEPLEPSTEVMAKDAVLLRQRHFHLKNGFWWH